MYLWLWRELYHALEKATCAVFRHCSRREMASPNGIRLLKFLDSYIYDCFDDNDSDRDSDKKLDWQVLFVARVRTAMPKLDSKNIPSLWNASPILSSLNLAVRILFSIPIPSGNWSLCTGSATNQ